MSYNFLFPIMAVGIIKNEACRVCVKMQFMQGPRHTGAQHTVMFFFWVAGNARIGMFYDE